MNKRGQGLPLNVIVIAIIVVVALVVIVAFFLGAFGNLGSRTGTTTSAALEGTDLNLAGAKCESLCNQAQTSKGILKPAFCSTKFSIDQNNDGKIEGKDEEDILCDKLVQCKDTDTGKSVCE